MTASSTLALAEVVPEHDTRRRLLRTGMELFTELGFNGISLGDILGHAGLPKGCFYHHFTDKEDYVIAVIQAYDVWFSDKLATCLDDETRPVCDRLEVFMEKALVRMRRHGFKRGCLVGNLGQEMGGHTAAVRAALDLAWSGWERRMAALFQLGQARGEISDKVEAEELAALFWTGWEGAILRAKLLHAPDPVQRFARHFLTQLKSVSL